MPFSIKSTSTDKILNYDESLLLRDIQADSLEMLQNIANQTGFDIFALTDAQGIAKEIIGAPASQDIRKLNDHVVEVEGVSYKFFSVTDHTPADFNTPLTLKEKMPVILQVGHSDPAQVEFIKKVIADNKSFTPDTVYNASQYQRAANRLEKELGKVCFSAQVVPLQVADGSFILQVLAVPISKTPEPVIEIKDFSSKEDLAWYLGLSNEQKQSFDTKINALGVEVEKLLTDHTPVTADKKNKIVRGIKQLSRQNPDLEIQKFDFFQQDGELKLDVVLAIKPQDVVIKFSDSEGSQRTIHLNDRPTDKPLGRIAAHDRTRCLFQNFSDELAKSGEILAYVKDGIVVPYVNPKIKHDGDAYSFVASEGGREFQLVTVKKPEIALLSFKLPELNGEFNSGFSQDKLFRLFSDNGVVTSASLDHGLETLTRFYAKKGLALKDGQISCEVKNGALYVSADVYQVAEEVEITYAGIQTLAQETQAFAHTVFSIDSQFDLTNLDSNLQSLGPFVDINLNTLTPEQAEAIQNNFSKINKDLARLEIQIVIATAQQASAQIGPDHPQQPALQQLIQIGNDLLKSGAPTKQIKAFNKQTNKVFGSIGNAYDFSPYVKAQKQRETLTTNFGYAKDLFGQYHKIQDSLSAQFADIQPGENFNSRHFYRAIAKINSQFRLQASADVATEGNQAKPKIAISHTEGINMLHLMAGMQNSALVVGPHHILTSPRGTTHETNVSVSVPVQGGGHTASSVHTFQPRDNGKQASVSLGATVVNNPGFVSTASVGIQDATPLGKSKLTFIKGVGVDLPFDGKAEDGVLEGANTLYFNPHVGFGYDGTNEEGEGWTASVQAGPRFDLRSGQAHLSASINVEGRKNLDGLTWQGLVQDESNQVYAVLRGSAGALIGKNIPLAAQYQQDPVDIGGGAYIQAPIKFYTSLLAALMTETNVGKMQFGFGVKGGTLGRIRSVGAGVIVQWQGISILLGPSLVNGIPSLISFSSV